MAYQSVTYRIVTVDTRKIFLFKFQWDFWLSTWLLYQRNETPVTGYLIVCDCSVLPSDVVLLKESEYLFPEDFGLIHTSYQDCFVWQDTNITNDINDFHGVTDS